MRSPSKDSAMLSPAHLLVSAFVLATLCSCASTPARQKQPIANHAHTLQQRLIDEDWMLYSPVFPAITNDGYPIDFQTDGLVQTRNLSLVETWQLTEDLTLQLASIKHAPIMAFAYVAEDGVFVFHPLFGPAFVIGPKGFHFMQYSNKLAAKGSPAH